MYRTKQNADQGRNMSTTPTASSYAGLSRAYDHFNRRLFGGTLPQCLITLQRHKGAYGFFHAQRFSELRDKSGPPDLDEIALNPSTFHGRKAVEILSTLVHEMVHLWQQHQGKPSRGGYHNKEWAAQMNAVGLTPTDTGQAGGKQTGPKVTHMIVHGGPFDCAARDFLLSETMPLYGDPNTDDAAAKKKAASKTKYTCPTCEQNAWAKPDAHLVCGDCEEPMKPETKEDEDE